MLTLCQKKHDFQLQMQHHAFGEKEKGGGVVYS